MEKKILRDILEDADGNPKTGETLDLMKKELKRMKVAENRENPFKKGIALIILLRILIIYGILRIIGVGEIIGREINM